MPELNVVVAFETPQGAGNGIVLSQYIGLLDALVSSRCSKAPCR
jgi:hypothetical protein